MTEIGERLIPIEIDSAALESAEYLQQLYMDASNRSPIYDENYQHLRDIAAESQSPERRIRDAVIMYTELARPLKLLPGVTLLDVGAGLGRPGHYLRHTGVNTINIDVNPAAHTTAKELWGKRNHHNVHVVSNCAEELPLKDDSVDAICSQDFFEHIAPASITAALTEMDRVLKGRRMAHRITVTEEPHNLYADPTHQTFWSAEEWKAWFADNGWNTIAPTTRHTLAPARKRIVKTPYCHGYFLLERS